MHRLFHVAAARSVCLLPVALVLPLLCFSPAAADDATKKIAGKTLTILCEKENVIVKQGNQLLLRYRYRGVPKKPYVAEMTSPGGVSILRDAPADHLHHHALMFAWTVNGVDFWGEQDGSGSQVHQAWEDLRIDSEGGAERAVLREQLVWQTPDGNVLLEEERTLVIPATAADRPRMLTWQADFSAGKSAGGMVTITGTKYHGLGMRFIKAMDADGLHFNADGGVKVAGTNGKRAPWSGYTAQTSPGKKVTVAMFGAPTNPRHPAEWFTMGQEQGFAYLSGTLGVGTEPLKLKPGTTMSVRFAVAVFEGAMDAKRIHSVYRKMSRTPK